MDICIDKPIVGGKVRAISAKASAHRLLICAALADKSTRLECTDVSDDINATVNCLTSFGAGIVRRDSGFDIVPVNFSSLPEKALARCAESGSTFRFLIPIAAALGIETDFFPEKRLPERPLSPLYEELVRHGISLSKQGSVPFTVRGKLVGGEYTLAANVSSQFISGLLFALPLTGEDSTLLLTEKFESKSYVKMTVNALKAFGIDVSYHDKTFYIPGGGYSSPRKVTAEGDWSNAAFWLVCGAIGKAPVTVTGLDFSSAQGDMACVDVLREFGADVKTDYEKGECTVYPSSLHGISINAENIPDLVPVLSLAASVASGKTVIYNAARLKLKESDRLFTVCETLKYLGGRAEQTDDGLIIYGGKLHGGVCDSFSDHRIAMTAAVASSAAEGSVTVKNASAVAKSYPGFWKDFEKLGGVIRTVN